MATKVGAHAAWAMAVGGMIGGGIYTLAGVIIGEAGELAWLSIVIGASIALATVHSYNQLLEAPRGTAVPVNVIAADVRRDLAAVVAWALLVVYVLALAVYTFSFGHYIGNAIGLPRPQIALVELAVGSVLGILNLLRLQQPVRVQIAAVWIELAVLGGLAAIGLWRWNPANLSAHGASADTGGVIQAAAQTFIAFEGFEMLAYDLRELRRPRRTMASTVPAAIVIVAASYIVVTLGAASLVGGDALVHHREAALAVAGREAAGTPGLIIVTIAACLAAVSAINATLFSAARLARSTAERKFLPRWCATCNRHEAPVWSTLAIAIAATATAMLSSLDQLVSAASLGFLLLFGVVNLLALRRPRGYIAAFGLIGTGVGAVVIVARLVS